MLKAILSNASRTLVDFDYQMIKTKSRPVIMIMTFEYSLLQIVKIKILPAYILKLATQVPMTESTLIPTLNQPTTMNPTKTMSPPVWQTPPHSRQALLHYTLQSTDRM